MKRDRGKIEVDRERKGERGREKVAEEIVRKGSETKSYIRSVNVTEIEREQE